MYLSTEEDLLQEQSCTYYIRGPEAEMKAPMKTWVLSTNEKMAWKQLSLGLAFNTDHISLPLRP